MLTDSHGRKVSFTNTVVIMTSNIGAHALVEERGSPRRAEVRDAVLSQVRAHFAPEFINRIGAPAMRAVTALTAWTDDIVMFNRLQRGHMDELLRIRMHEVQARLAPHKITLDLAADAAAHLCEAGYNPAYGARPLNRVVKTQVLDPLSRAILSGAVRDEETVHATLRDGRIHVVPNHQVDQGVELANDIDEEEEE